MRDGDVAAADVTEHRLALVMNGGVSLAVWMGGVAQEIDTLRRASNGFAPPPAGDPGDLGAAAERALFEKWAQVAAAAGTRFTVDVIAGTSAGGLNGVLLAAAIAKGVPLAGLRELWMKAPALTGDRLLRPQPGDPTSVLNGDYFREQIAAAIAQLSADAAAGARGPAQAAPADVSLTVTATALGGAPRAVQDRNGTAFLEQDHRRRYGFRRVGEQYRYRAGATPPFSPDPVDDLAPARDPELGLVGRATASFPAVFSPVRETFALRTQRVWPTWDTGDDAEYLADGGILDNSPFDSVLDAVAAQPVEAAWTRTLCFIVPSADELGHAVAPDPTVPPPWTAVVAAALNDPREADLRDDVEQMHALVRAGRTGYDLSRLALLLDGPADAQFGGRTPFDVARDLAVGGFVLYRGSRRAAAVYDALDVAATALPQAYLDPQVVVTAADVAGDHPWVADAFPTALPTGWTWGIAPAQRIVSLLVRSLAARGPEFNGLRRTLSTIGLQLTAVRAAVTAAIADAVAGSTDIPSPAAMAAILDDAFTSLEVPVVLAGLVVDAVTAYAAGTVDTAGEPRDPLRVLETVLCVEVVNGSGGAPIDLGTRPRFDFLRLGISEHPPLLAPAFVAAAGGATPAKSDILYGSRLNHFAAFGREQWRSWDWLWGRIHGAVQLASLLGLDPATVDEIVTLIVQAEDRTVGSVLARIPEVLALTADDLIEDMADDGVIRPTVDAVFDLLASDAPTQPPVPAELTRVGKGLRALGHLSGRIVQIWLRH